MRAAMLRGLGRGLGFVVAPSALLAGCFGASSTQPSPEGGDFESGTFEGGGSPHDGGTGDATTHDAGGGDGDATSGEGGAEAGEGGSPATDLTAGTIDFGAVDCGAKPSSNTLTFKNTGTAPLTYSLSLANGTLFSLAGAPSSGSVAPGQSATVTIAATTVPVASTAGAAITDTLTVKTNAASAATVLVTLKVTPQGGTLTLTPPTAAFGQAFLNVQAPDVPLTITNTGNAAVTVALGAPQDAEFATTWTGSPTGVSLAPGATLPGAAARFKPTSTGAKTDASAITVTGAVCGTSATSVALSGTGSTAPVSIGPGTLAFGPTFCSTAAPSQSVTLTSTASTAITYTATLAKGTFYTLTGGSGTIPANGKATITVQPGTVPPDPTSIPGTSLGDTLTVTTGPGGGGAAATIALTQT